MNLTTQQESDFQAATICHICQKAITDADDKVRDHCHLTGRFRGAAHNKCNLQYHPKRVVPVLFHNFSKYDCHLFIKELAKYDEHSSSIEPIPNNMETYTSLDKMIMLNRASGGQNIYMKVSFRDSLRFLAGSLEKLAKNLDPSTDYKNLDRWMIADLQRRSPELNIDEVKEIIARLRGKGIFPYELAQSLEDLENITSFPPIEKFSTCLTGAIDQEDYENGKFIYSQFKCRNLGDYSDVYLKTDVMILADVFEQFRSFCLDQTLYGLDPAHYFTAPGLAWDAMLKVSFPQSSLKSNSNSFFHR